MITDEQLKEWRALADAATPEPWLIDEAESCIGDVFSLIEIGGIPFNDTISTVGSEGERYVFNLPDAKLIAAAREAVPALIDEVERLREEFCHKEEEASCAKWDAARLQKRLDAIKEAP